MRADSLPTPTILRCPGIGCPACADGPGLRTGQVDRAQLGADGPASLPLTSGVGWLGLQVDRRDVFRSGRVAPEWSRLPQSQGYTRNGAAAIPPPPRPPSNPGS